MEKKEAEVNKAKNWRLDKVCRISITDSDNDKVFGSNSGTYASIVIINTPMYNNVVGQDGPMEILLPPNLKSTIEQH